MGLVTFTDKFQGASLTEYAARFPSSVGDLAPPGDGVALDVTAIARANAGRWIADCPQSGCDGAMYVNFDDPRFFCCECRNAGFGGVPVKIALPKDREAIEAVLLERPVPATRNWTPGETIGQLEAENANGGQ